MEVYDKKVMFNNEDTWSLDNTLSPIIAAGLRNFIKLKKECPETWSIPTGFFPMNDIPPGKPEWYVTMDMSDPDKALDIAEKRWDEVLDTMLYAFEADVFADDFNEDKHNLGLKYFGEHFRKLWR